MAATFGISSAILALIFLCEFGAWARPQTNAVMCNVPRYFIDAPEFNNKKPQCPDGSKLVRGKCKMIFTASRFAPEDDCEDYFKAATTKSPCARGYQLINKECTFVFD